MPEGYGTLVARHAAGLPIRLDTPYLELDPDIGIVPGPPDDPADTAARTFAVAVTDVGRVAMQQAVLTGLTTCLAAARPAPTCPLPSERYVPGGSRRAPCVVRACTAIHGCHRWACRTARRRPFRCAG